MLNENDSYLARLECLYTLGAIQNAMTRPSVLYRPTLIQRAHWADETTNHWNAMYGGVMGIGASPEEAMANFDKVWLEKLPEPTPVDGKLGKMEVI